MKRDKSLFLNDILESIEHIEDFVEGISEDKFYDNELIKSAVIRKIEIIGEAAKNIPEEFRKKYNFIPWRDITGIRDVIIHAYFGVDTHTIWKVINEDLPILKENIEKVIKLETKIKESEKNRKEK